MPHQRRRGTSIVRNILAAQRYEARPLNFAKPTFLLGAGDRFTAPVQLASLTYVFQSVIGQIVCPDNVDQFEPNQRAQAEDCLRSPPLRRSAGDALVPNRRVFVRYTTDDWKTFRDAEAIFTSQYWPNGSVSFSCYSFKLDSTLDFAGPHTLHFAVCVQLLADQDRTSAHDATASDHHSRSYSPPPARRAMVVREEHWDDNFGQNYRVHMAAVGESEMAQAAR